MTEREFQEEVVEELLRSSSKFRSLMMLYRSAIREVITKLEVLNDEFSIEHMRNPIASIHSRIKTPKSIFQKLKNRGYEITPESIKENLNDVAGIRVICPFISDIYHVADLLVSQDDITVIKIKDYIEHPKENGYRSYHMIIEVPVFLSDGKCQMRAEVQIRTIGMDFWASLEHQLRYKKGLEDIELYDQINQRLKRSARTISNMDIEMEEVKEILEEFHKQEKRLEE